MEDGDVSAKRYTCGTPMEHCTGQELGHKSAMLRLEGPRKAHTSRREAYKCTARYLVRVLGYTQGRNHEFHKEGHPCRVLTRPSRFGGELRVGKCLESGRWMPEGKGAGGLVASI